jgi:uncharacterized protein YraI
MNHEALIVGAALLTVAVAAPVRAETLTGIANASTYLHAGPGDDFPVISHVPPGADLSIIGCSHGVIWCDVTWNGNRGWLSARFLDTILHDERVGFMEYHTVIKVPVVTFDKGAYWRDHYASYPFYASSSYWATPAETPDEVRSVRYNGVDE